MSEMKYEKDDNLENHVWIVRFEVLITEKGVRVVGKTNMTAIATFFDEPNAQVQFDLDRKAILKKYNAEGMLDELGEAAMKALTTSALKEVEE